MYYAHSTLNQYLFLLAHIKQPYLSEMHILIHESAPKHSFCAQLYFYVTAAWKTAHIESNPFYTKVQKQMNSTMSCPRRTSGFEISATIPTVRQLSWQRPRGGKAKQVIIFRRFNLKVRRGVPGDANRASERCLWGLILPLSRYPIGGKPTRHVLLYQMDNKCLVT